MPRRTLSHSDTSPSAARPAEPSPRAQSMPCTSSPAPGSNLPEKRPRRPGCCIRFPLLPLASKRCWARRPETASHQRPRRTRSPFAPSPPQPPCSPAAGAFLEPCPGRCPSPTTSSCGLRPPPDTSVPSRLTHTRHCSWQVLKRGLPRSPPDRRPSQVAGPCLGDHNRASFHFSVSSTRFGLVWFRDKCPRITAPQLLPQSQDLYTILKYLRCLQLGVL